MQTKTLVVVETEHAFVQEFRKILKGQYIFEKYPVTNIVPEFMEGFDHMLEKCRCDIQEVGVREEIAAIYVDLSISDTVTDQQGIALAMGIREDFPATPIFCITNKNRYDNNFDNLSDASLEDFDGVFEKKYLTGKDFSETRLIKMLAKGNEKRSKAVNSRPLLTGPKQADTPYRCDVAFITALFQYEFEQVKNWVVIDDALSKKVGTASTKVGILKGSTLRVLIDYQQKMGMVDASILATTVAANYAPKLLIMTGVCGSRASKGVKVGDIIIPGEVYDYQMGKLDKGKFKPYPFRAVVDTELISKLREWQNEIIRKMEDEAVSQKNRIRHTTLHFDMMACGSLVLKTDNALEDIAQNLDEKTVAVEMESYGIARTCDLPPYNKATKALVIKASMDGSGADKNDDDKEWAAQVSAAFAYHFLLKLEADGYFVS